MLFEPTIPARVIARDIEGKYADKILFVSCPTLVVKTRDNDAALIR